MKEQTKKHHVRCGNPNAEEHWIDVEENELPKPKRRTTIQCPKCHWIASYGLAEIELCEQRSL